MTIFHGMRVNEPVTGARAIVTAASAIIGLVATAPDALEADFPIGKPMLVGDIRTAIGKAGATGTLVKALGSIADQCSPIVVVVRVAPGVAAGEVTAEEATEANVVAGVQALLHAESITGQKPRILGAPGLDTEAVTTAMASVAEQLRAFIYAAGIGEDIAAVTDYAENFGARELMLIWPDFTGWAGQAVATAMGLRALLDETVGFAQGISNNAVNGATGISIPVTWNLQDASTEAQLLNNAKVTTLIRKDGFRFWGNRTTAELDDKFTFEVATRTAQIMADTMAEGCFPFVDKPITKALATDALGSINAKLRAWATPGAGPDNGQIVGGAAWLDDSLNPPEQLAAGKMVLDYDYTPCAPWEDGELNQRITDQYYSGFGDDLS